jgi:hypothetical protein
MKKIVLAGFIFIVLISLLLIFVLIKSDKKGNIMNMKEYYSMEDFDSIIIKKSTYKDVFEIAPIDSMQITSYGGFCIFPKKDGGYIRIDFVGNDLIVINITEVNSDCPITKSIN